MQKEPNQSHAHQHGKLLHHTAQQQNAQPIHTQPQILVQQQIQSQGLIQQSARQQTQFPGRKISNRANTTGLIMNQSVNQTKPMGRIGVSVPQQIIGHPRFVSNDLSCFVFDTFMVLFLHHQGTVNAKCSIDRTATVFGYKCVATNTSNVKCSNKSASDIETGDIVHINL